MSQLLHLLFDFAPDFRPHPWCTCTAPTLSHLWNSQVVYSLVSKYFSPHIYILYRSMHSNVAHTKTKICSISQRNVFYICFYTVGFYAALIRTNP